MQIEFDPDKDAANFAKHGLRLAAAEQLDLKSALIVTDLRTRYGERRWRAFGRVDGEGRCLAFTYRADVVRVISFRRAHARELRRYGL